MVALAPGTAVQPSEAQCETGDLISFLFSYFKKKRKGKRPIRCRNKKKPIQLGNETLMRSRGRVVRIFADL